MTDNRNNIKTLEAMHDIIRDFHEGVMNRRQAEQEYLKMLALVRDMTVKSGHTAEAGSLRSLLAFHNVNNFSKATVLYQMTAHGPEAVEACGDPAIISLMPGFLTQTSGQEAEKSRRAISQTESITYNLAARALAAGKNEMILASVSSSPYYSDAKFDFLAEILKGLYAALSAEEDPLCIDLQHETSAKIIKYFKEHRRAGLTDGIVYFFPRINSTFGHLGIRKVKNVSWFILETLRHRYPSADLIVSLNFKTYVCVLDVSESNPSGKGLKIDFVYDGITLPYKTKKIPIEENLLVYQFLDLVYSFENDMESVNDNAGAV